MGEGRGGREMGEGKKRGGGRGEKGTLSYTTEEGEEKIKSSSRRKRREVRCKEIIYTHLPMYCQEMGLRGQSLVHDTV